MGFTTKLFTISIKNNYYQAGWGKDFEIMPMAHTQRWFNLRNIRMLNQPDGISLVWLSEHYDDPMQLLRTKIQGQVASFALFLSNPHLFNYSLLTREVGKIYHLHNISSHTHARLHSGPFLDHRNLVDEHKLIRQATTNKGAMFALIDIDLSKWWDEQIQQPEPINYQVLIESRAVFWRYHIVDEQKKLHGQLKVVSKKDITYFKEIDIAQIGQQTSYCMTSKKPVHLHDKYDLGFSLYQIELGGETQRSTRKKVIDQLPYPAFDRLVQDKQELGKYYSDMFAYV